MIGTTYKEFYDKLYYGTDIELSYNGAEYIINSTGVIIDNKLVEHHIRMYKINAFDKSLLDLYDEKSSSIEDSINDFVNAQLFDEKSFLEVEHDIEIHTML